MFIGENPIHINVENKEDVAKLVLMPGDPLRAKYIAEKFLENAKEITSVRNMLGFTGFYKGKKITVMGSGMGMPSMSIYSFELFHFFDVDRIIRIGTCGVVSKEVEVPEMILADRIYSESTFAYQYDGYTKNTVEGSKRLNKIISLTAKELNMTLHEGDMLTTDVFGPYVDIDAILNRVPSYIKLLGEEMEGFGLLHVANSFTKEAAVIATAVDSKYSDVVLSIEQREKSLNDMITLALESIIK